MKTTNLINTIARGRAPLLILALLALTLALLPASSLAAPVAARTIDIGAARGLPLGSTVTLKGTVTAPSGAFESGTFKGFAIQDKTGGMYVSVVGDLGLRMRCKKVDCRL